MAETLWKQNRFLVLCGGFPGNGACGPLDKPPPDVNLDFKTNSRGHKSGKQMCFSLPLGEGSSFSFSSSFPPSSSLVPGRTLDALDPCGSTGPSWIYPRDYKSIKTFSKHTKTFWIFQGGRQAGGQAGWLARWQAGRLAGSLAGWQAGWQAG